MRLFEKCSKVIASMVVTISLLVIAAVPVFASSNHTVTFMYGTKVYQTVVADGCTALPPTDTYVPGYIFAGWVGNSTNVKSDMTILGAYLKVDAPAPAPAPAQQDTDTTQYFDVKFVDGLTGAEYYSERVPAGGSCNPPEVPHHDGYHFDHYDGSYDNVYDCHTVTVIYDQDYYDTDWQDALGITMKLYYLKQTGQFN